MKTSSVIMAGLIGVLAWFAIKKQPSGGNGDGGSGGGGGGTVTPTYLDTIKQKINADQWTATSDQLNDLVSHGIAIGSSGYQKLVDLAYNRVVSKAAPGQSSSWSGSLGFYLTAEQYYY